jgi:hypothetical protein
VATPERARIPAARVALDGAEAREESWGNVENRETGGAECDVPSSAAGDTTVNADVAKAADAGSVVAPAPWAEPCAVPTIAVSGVGPTTGPVTLADVALGAPPSPVWAYVAGWLGDAPSAARIVATLELAPVAPSAPTLLTGAMTAMDFGPVLLAADAEDGPLLACRPLAEAPGVVVRGDAAPLFRPPVLAESAASGSVPPATLPRLSPDVPAATVPKLPVVAGNETGPVVWPEGPEAAGSVEESAAAVDGSAPCVVDECDGRTPVAAERLMRE